MRSLVGETAARLESLPGEARYVSLAGSYAGFRISELASVEGVPRRDGQRGEGGTIRGFGPARESAAMFGFDPGVSSMDSSGFKPTIPVSRVNISRFLGGSKNQWFTPDSIVLTPCSQGRIGVRT